MSDLPNKLLAEARKHGDWCSTCGRGWSWVDGNKHRLALESLAADKDKQIAAEKVRADGLEKQLVTGGTAIVANNEALRAQVAELSAAVAVKDEALNGAWQQLQYWLNCRDNDAPVNLAVNDTVDLIARCKRAMSPASALRWVEAQIAPWRKILWLRHGCGVEQLYGDDGEMQCAICGIDFKRDSIEAIQEHWRDKAEKALAALDAAKEKP